MTGLWVALAVACDGAAPLLAGLVPDRWLARYRAPMLGFATGTLLATGLGSILPEALASSGPVALVWVALALLAAAALEHSSSRRGAHRKRPVAPAALLTSDALHNVADGMAIAAAFLIGPRVGVVASAAVVLHEVPEEIADYALLRAAGMAKGRALAWLAAVQLTAGLGAAGTLLAAEVVARAAGAVLAAAAGLFVYIAIADLLPDLIRTRSRWGLVAGVIGAATALAVG